MSTESPAPLRIALVGPVAQSIPPERSGSVETVTAMLADGLVSRGHAVTLFATGSSQTRAELQVVFKEGYHRDTDLWPWELCELFNLAAAIEDAERFDVIHYQAEYHPISLPFTRLCPIPLLQTLHHAPSATEVALWSRYDEAPFIAVSETQAELLRGLNVAGIVHHAVDPELFTPGSAHEDALLFLGRFVEGKGVLEAIDVARRSDRRLLLVAAETDYYREAVASHVDGAQIRYLGEADQATKVELLQRAAALVYPVQRAESFGLVLAEAMMCGTPVVALGCGAVGELVDPECGMVCDDVPQMAEAVPAAIGLDRTRIRERALERFGPDRMVREHEAVYRQLIETTATTAPTLSVPS